MEDKVEKIREALLMMDSMDDEQWTTDGSPKVDKVSELGEFETLTRAEILDAAPHFSRENFDVALITEEPVEEEKPEEEVNTMGYKHPDIVAAQEAYNVTVADLAKAKIAEREAGAALSEVTTRLMRQGPKSKHETTHNVKAAIEASNKARAARVAEFNANKAMITGKPPRSPLDEAKKNEKREVRPLMRN